LGLLVIIDKLALLSLINLGYKIFFLLILHFNYSRESVPIGWHGFFEVFEVGLRDDEGESIDDEAEHKE
jgi:hypothetical protein